MSFVPRSLEELSHEFPPELAHISASSLKMAVRCEEQWRQRYILGKKVPPSLGMLAGRADHKAIGESMTRKLTSGEDLPVSEVQDLYVQILEDEVELEGGLSGLEGGSVDAFDHERKHGQEVVAVYHRSVSPTLQPVAIEQEFRIQVPELPVEVLGYVDLIADAAYPNLFINNPGERIIERKRRKNASTKIVTEWTIQAEIYQLAYPLNHEWQISAYGTKRPTVVTALDSLTLLQAPRNPALTQRLMQQLVAKLGWLYQRYGPDEPWPTSGKLHPWACTMCGYRPNCWGWQT